MAFVRPTLSELVDRVQQDLVSRLALSSPILRRSMVYVLSRVLAGAVHMLHAHLEFLSRQVFPDQADGDYLVRHAALFGLARKPAEYAVGPVAVTGTNGTVVPAGAVLLRADGTRYVVDEAVTIAGGAGALTVTAGAAGAAANAGAGTALTFESPIAGVNATAAVGAGGLVNGSDEESEAALRGRLLERLREPPHGGSAADYVAWAKQVPGVTRAWCYPTELGAGTVVVRFARDDDASPIPDAAEVAAVQAHIDERRPVTAALTVLAPVAVARNYTIHLVPDTAATRAAVEAELRDLLRREAYPGGILLLSRIRNAIGDAEGVSDFTLTSPAADVTTTTGQMLVHGVITWT